MLLSLLNRKEKLKFLDLAIYMIAVDGEPTEIERRVLDMMLAELGKDLAEEYTFELRNDVESTIQFFKEANQAVKRIVYLNLVKLMMIDDLYNTSEHFFIEDIEEAFEITQAIRHDLMKIIYDERDLREKARRLIQT